MSTLEDELRHEGYNVTMFALPYDTAPEAPSTEGAFLLREAASWRDFFANLGGISLRNEAPATDTRPAAEPNARATNVSAHMSSLLMPHQVAFEGNLGWDYFGDASYDVGSESFDTGTGSAYSAVVEIADGGEAGGFDAGGEGGGGSEGAGGEGE